MSGFGNNFSDQDTNPFSDPAVMQAAKSSAAGSTLEEYNPFAETAKLPPPPQGGVNPSQYKANYSSNQPAVMTPTPEPPPPYSQSAEQRITTDELQRRQEELEKKAAELQRKEEELRNASYNAPRANNWPPLPSKFCVGPCFYQDINLEIPLEFQKLVRTMYYLWLFHACVLVLNVLGALSLLIMDAQFSTFFLALLFLVLFTPFSYICWFRPIYKAFRSDSSFNFFLFFFIFFFQCITTGLLAVGIPGAGACGWMSGSDAVKKNTAVGILCFITASAFTLLLVAYVYMLIKVHRIYRNTGASFAKAQQEFTTGVLRHEHVQNAAANVASAAVRQQMSNTTGGNRY